MLMRFKQGSFQVKSIYISLFFVLSSLFVSGCSQEMAYETLRHSDKYTCESIINAEERIKCQNAKRLSYEEYQEYLKKTDKDGL
jgi:hypothetical protein